MKKIMHTQDVFLLQKKFHIVIEKVVKTLGQGQGFSPIDPESDDLAWTHATANLNTYIPLVDGG